MDPLVGAVGRITLAILAGKPGQVTVPIRGAYETYTAWADEPIDAGTRVVVIDHPGARSVTVALMT